jgi:hypothetical protein
LNNDGVQDPILAHYIQHVNRPAYPRDDILIQLASFKKKYPNYASYADATLDQFLGDTKPFVLQSDIFASAYLENKGNGDFELSPLPIEAQLAPVFGISAGEFTGDGVEDAVLVGNFYSPDVLTGQYDAFTGLLLKGNGDGSFKPLSFQESGIAVNGDAKGLAVLKMQGDKTLLLAAQNNDSLRVFVRRDKQRLLKAEPGDSYAIITRANGQNSKHEFYYGSGYLSQSSRSFRLPDDVQTVRIFDFRGNARLVSINQFK